MLRNRILFESSTEETEIGRFLVEKWSKSKILWKLLILVPKPSLWPKMTFQLLLLKKKTFVGWWLPLRAIPFKNGEGGRNFADFRDPPYKKWHFWDPHTTKLHFRDPSYKKCHFWDPPYKKLHFHDPPYKKWHFRDTPYYFILRFKSYWFLSDIHRAQ